MVQQDAWCIFVMLLNYCLLIRFGNRCNIAVGLVAFVLLALLFWAFMWDMSQLICTFCVRTGIILFQVFTYVAQSGQKRNIPHVIST